MKNNSKHRVVARIARVGFVPAALLALMFSAAGISYAQSNPAPADGPKATPVKTEPAKAPASPAAKAPSKGSGEGIAVHGHWIVEVKNPDGTLAARREFENTLDPIEGADLLTGLISGEYVTDGFFIAMYSASGPICGGLECDMFDSRTPYLCHGAGSMCNSALKYTPNTGTPNNNAVGFTLSGSIQLQTTDGGTVNGVATGVVGCVPVPSALSLTGTTPYSGVANAAATAAYSFLFLPYPPGQYGTGTPCATNSSGVGALYLDLTSRTISQTVSGGQSIAVTVMITFGG